MVDALAGVGLAAGILIAAWCITAPPETYTHLDNFFQTERGIR